MSTPEIDLRNMLDREAYDEDLDDAYTHWVEYTVIPDLAKYLALFDYDKFDSAVTHFRIYGATPFVEWLFTMIAEDFEIYYTFMTRDKNMDYVDFAKLAETYTDCFVCVDHFIQYNEEVILNDY